jgi:hypothetical protein
LSYVNRDLIVAWRCAAKPIFQDGPVARFASSVCDGDLEVEHAAEVGDTTEEQEQYWRDESQLDKRLAGLISVQAPPDPGQAPVGPPQVAPGHRGRFHPLMLTTVTGEHPLNLHA